MSSNCTTQTHTHAHTVKTCCQYILFISGLSCSTKWVKFLLYEEVQNWVSLNYCLCTAFRPCLWLSCQQFWRCPPPHPPPSSSFSFPAPCAHLALNDNQSSTGTSAHPPLHPGRGHRWARKTSSCGCCENIKKKVIISFECSHFSLSTNETLFKRFK